LVSAGQGRRVSRRATKASAIVVGFGRSGGPLGVTVGGVPGGWVDGGRGGVLVAGGIEGSGRSATPGVGWVPPDDVGTASVGAVADGFLARHA
jgi:hypothetical protein